MPTNGRTAEQVRREIEAERDQLAGAVDHLRGELGHVTDIAAKVKARLPLVAGAAATVGFVLAGGIGATMRYAARRGREGDEKVHFGRWSLRRR
jgi:Protein of unknown function (DUF3618)